MTYYDVVIEAVYWLRVIVVTAVVMAIGVYSAIGFGYFSQKVEDKREIRCINAACEKPCVDGQKLKRHEGCK